jgi:hypothetical protein
MSRRPTDYSIIGDARRQSFYLARVENGRLLPDLEIVSAEIARERTTDGDTWLTFDPKPPLALPHVRSARAERFTTGESQCSRWVPKSSPHSSVSRSFRITSPRPSSRCRSAPSSPPNPDRHDTRTDFQSRF